MNKNIERKYIYITTTRNPYAAEEIEEAFKSYADDYVVRNWCRVFNDPEKPDEEDVRYYWEFKALVTKEQELKLRKVVHDCQFPMRRGFMA